MRLEKRFAPLITIVIAILVIGAGVGVFLFIQKRNTPVATTTGFDHGTVLKTSSQATLPITMTFSVTVPENTSETDIVCVHTNSQKKHKMIKVGPYTHEISLDYKMLGINDAGEQANYRYDRNCSNFWTAEYLEPDTNDYFWTKRGRNTIFEPGKTQRDVVKRWRWFPLSGVALQRTTTLTPDGSFLPRINATKFRSGQIIEDLYVEGFRNHFASTAQHMKKMGYAWVEIDPPWQWTEENGLPKVVNLKEENPNYPDDQTLIDEIMAFKAEGIKVMLGPQLCCTNLETKNRTDAWWDAYFRETTKFLVHFAKIAEQSGVGAMHYAIGNDYWKDDYAQRWSAVFKEIRKYFSGEVGEMVWNFGSELGAIIPDANYIAWGKELDYFYIAVDAPISLKDNPSDDELKNGVATMLDGVKQLYNRYEKPIFVRTTYFNVKKTWKGNSFYSISSIPWIGDSERKIKESVYEYGPEDQARVIQAYFRAIAERPWIIGYAQFGYTHWEYPLATDLSVRGKPSEDLWKKWNEFIYEDMN